MIRFKKGFATSNNCGYSSKVIFIFKFAPNGDNALHTPIYGGVAFEEEKRKFLIFIIRLNMWEELCCCLLKI